MRDFCQWCGATVPPIEGEGTCTVCDPEGVKRNIMNHPNLSDEINANILRSELNGGFDVKDLAVGKSLRVTTKNTVYTIHRVDGSKFTISGSAKFCPEPVNCRVHGSTWGGSMLKIGFIGIGMHLEVGLEIPGEGWGTITTSKIQKVEEV